MTDGKSAPAKTESSEAEPAKKTEEDTPRKVKKGAEGPGLEERLKAAEEKAEENYDRVLRVTADFENYKKRVEREVNDFKKFANESLVKEILPIVDNLERALAIKCEDNSSVVAFDSLREGVEMTLKGLMDSLKKFGVVSMETLEKPFDPNFHQAVSQEESEKYPDNTITQELQKGYMLGDRLLRAPMVVVSKRPDTKVEAKEKPSEDKSKIKVTIH